jgi:D-arabinose 1-dehydrogenase-like Zn-dependent alcohol dehydrogenase
VGWHAVQKAGLTPDDVPLVIGCGPVGLAVIASLKISGVHPIIAADFSSKRRALAVEMGADIVVDPGEMSPYMSWHQAATPAGYDGSRYAQLFGFSPKLPPAVIFECVGVPGVIQQVIDGAPAGARVVIVGVCMQTDQFEPFFGVVKQLKLQFVLGYTGEEFAASLNHIAEGRIAVTPLITGHVGLGGVKGAFAELANPEQHAKSDGRAVVVGDARYWAPSSPRADHVGLLSTSSAFIEGRSRDGAAPTAAIRRVANNKGHGIIRRNPGVENGARSRRGSGLRFEDSVRCAVCPSSPIHALSPQ